jgi:predicted RNase H-like HicB family nuclease
MSRVYTVALLREDEGGYAVVVPALPSCVTQGPTLAEALERVKEAIAGYIETLDAHGEPVPEDRLKTQAVLEACEIANKQDAWVKVPK